MVFDERGEREEVEQVREVPPDVRAPVLAEALVVEAVHLRDLPTLVVPAEDSYAVAVAQLHRDEQCDGLNGVVPAIDVIAHEEVIGVWRVAADLKELLEVVLFGLTG